MAGALAATGCVNVQLFGGTPEPLTETTVSGDDGPKILLVRIDGVISSEEPEPDLLGGRQDNPVSRLREVLERAREDAEVRALLLRIDSPGGAATPTDLMYEEIVRYKRDSGVPVVAHIVGTAASGGYYVAMAAEHVVAQPTSITGSIGVLFAGVNFAGLMAKLGIANQTLIAGRYKDSGSPLRPMRAEERAYLQAILDELHGRFIGIVDAGRPNLDAGEVAELADGRIFTAEQALAHGLVDEVAGIDRAVAVASARAGLSEARVVTYHRNREYANNLLTRSPARPSFELRLPEPLRWTRRPGFYYLWSPGWP